MYYTNYELGRFGEKVAAKYLESKGYDIIQKNFMCRQGEIDIIARDFNELVFIEVKTRTGKDYGYPAEAVTKLKQKHMERAAKYYLYKNKQENKFVRFDVVEVIINNRYYSLNHIEQIK